MALLFEKRRRKKQIEFGTLETYILKTVWKCWMNFDRKDFLFSDAEMLPVFWQQMVRL